ncbi:pancreatic triacylglycerol lipase-like [Bacillus rossius redtenbacheri]|uniref:pancreatic triacylglycerol lipase-like n=1 Tax=Bacillus rossius redtenbacheri TaxID=93214 RepID=UPI002FDCA4AB
MAATAVLVVLLTAGLCSMVAGTLVDGATRLAGAAMGRARDAAKGARLLLSAALRAGQQAVKEAVAPDTPCYEPLGCFSMAAPWWSLSRLVPAPQSPEQVRTRFYLYTRTQPRRYEIQTRPDVTVEKPYYNSNRKTVVITHGYMSGGNERWLENMKTALLHKVDANVIIVDWGNAATKLNYFQVAANGRVVAAEIARVCKYLMTNLSMSPSSFHMIGHSLGAHIMSYVSSYEIKIGRITGLDPAGTLFEGNSSELHLDSSDAAFVDIIHTDARPLIPNLGLGIIKPYGNIVSRFK